MRNPNESKYFDEKYGCTLNANCSVCKKSIYVPEGIHTMYDGKTCTHNRPPYKVMSVFTMNLGCVCPECYEIISSDKDT